MVKSPPGAAFAPLKPALRDTVHLWIDVTRRAVCRAGLLLDSLLNVGSNGSAMIGIQCPAGTSPVGFSAGSMCLALTTFQAGP